MWKISPDDLASVTQGTYMGGACNALACQRGNGAVRVALDSCTHGQEYAGALALLELSKMDWAERWPNLRGMLVWSDLGGLAREGYGFVSVSGKAAPNLPTAGSAWNKHDMWVAYDRNSLWGSVCEDSMPTSHRAHRRLLDVFRPDCSVALHETVFDPIDAWGAGEGLLLIEEFPLAYSELGAMQGFGVFAPLIGWFAGTVGFPPYWKSALTLRNNPGFALFSEAAKTYRKRGGRLLSNLYLEIFRGFTALGRGRVTHSRSLIDAPWLTFTGYCLSHFGCPGVTLETFNTAYVGLRGIETRASQQLTYISALLDTLNAQGAGAEPKNLRVI